MYKNTKSKKYFMLKNIKFILLFFFLLSVFSCEDDFPFEAKKNLPEGHGEDLGIAFHKNGYQYPYEFDSTRGEPNCAGAKCHHSDLKGGLAESDSLPAVSPSCYQCHGKLWIEIDTAYKKIMDYELRIAN
ncbi:MAG: hypothetical protein A2X61_06810 [Ignavibacteria bacterium GWB2_35_12]|nr:MAG: hypothetical protein A2X63_10590 [Ignavibacteria bacterium GWA2_35_8]OGU40094.1 MAG: hypothetical protein A2X61_06810 [Ignavibacteria bacterium GWB2_35_12]OGU87413.1 MAG: hypothetical protein A2220_01390 [Ignavibacteria bacterium RIFOXYA2_FULL_35_10]OGV22024.1 MAG: hypothetical protein A2475_09310 [Ignavibacteria bacterium RIFOXYC2_FULL_35_21]